MVARSYADDPEEAHFLRIEIGGAGRLLCDEDLSRKLLQDSVRYFKLAGKKRVTWLSGRGGSGYELVA